VDRGDKKLIVVQRKSNMKEGNNPTQWPRGKPRFLHFSCYKENAGRAEKREDSSKSESYYFSYGGLGFCRFLT
jgi:hypothetical protein